MYSLILLLSCLTVSRAYQKHMGQWQPKKILFLRIIVSLQVCYVYCLCHSGDLTILAFCKKALNSSQILGVLSSSDFIHEIRISFPVLHILKNFINLVRRILLLLLTFLHYIFGTAAFLISHFVPQP